MSKESSTWHSDRLGEEITLVRWGEVGTPVLIFPTAGGDCEEIERFHMITVLAPLLEAKRIKAYSVDSIAGKAWLKKDNTSASAARVQENFDACLYHEVVPAIRQDCNDPDAMIIASGASLGAFNALAALCRHPDAYSKAICMSGTYGLEKFLEGPVTKEYYESSPLHFLPNMPEGQFLETLRQRYVLLTHGEGRYESPEESWNVAKALGAKGIPNRVDSWGEDYHHDWVTWRDMLPKYLEEFLDKPAEMKEEAVEAEVKAEPAAKAKPKAKSKSKSKRK